ncbi:MAG TPA: hypothetical protein PK819_03595 [Thermomicrobiales bacterium]|nr:hypothetical protein [Thermomicrobiales bacterium]
MDRDLLLFLVKRFGALYYPIVTLLWLFGPLSFLWFLILVIGGSFIGGTFWQIANGDHKKSGSKPTPVTYAPPPPNYQPPGTMSPAQADPYRTPPDQPS